MTSKTPNSDVDSASVPTPVDIVSSWAEALFACEQPNWQVVHPYTWLRANLEVLKGLL